MRSSTWKIIIIRPGLFNNCKRFPENPVAMLMEHDYLGRSSRKFPGPTEHLKRCSRFLYSKRKFAFHFLKAILSFIQVSGLNKTRFWYESDVAMRMREVLTRRAVHANGKQLGNTLNFPQTIRLELNPVPNIKQITLTLLEEDPLQSISKSA